MEHEKEDKVVESKDFENKWDVFGIRLAIESSRRNDPGLGSVWQTSHYVPIF